MSKFFVGQRGEYRFRNSMVPCRYDGVGQISKITDRFLYFKSDEGTVVVFNADGTGTSRVMKDGKVYCGDDGTPIPTDAEDGTDVGSTFVPVPDFQTPPSFKTDEDLAKLCRDQYDLFVDTINNLRSRGYRVKPSTLDYHGHVVIDKIVTI